MLALALVSLVLRLGDDAAVETTSVSCKTTLGKTALLEKNSSGMGRAQLRTGLVGRYQIWEGWAPVTLESGIARA